jgi:small subunit ribosomal protein S16
MAVKIRLSRTGKRNRPYARIVATDSRNKRDGAFLENLGAYDPIRHEVIQLNQDGIDRWVSKGAQLSGAVIKIVKLASKNNTQIEKNSNG